VGSERHLAVGKVLPIKREPLASAYVLDKCKVVAPLGAVVRSGHTIGEESQLGARPARHLDHVHLRHVGEAGGNEHLAARTIPVLKRRGTYFPVLKRLLGNGSRYRRDVFQYQIISRTYGLGLRRRLVMT